MNGPEIDTLTDAQRQTKWLVILRRVRAIRCRVIYIEIHRTVGTDGQVTFVAPLFAWSGARSRFG